jgi:short-subunit dehydrogenase
MRKNIQLRSFLLSSKILMRDRYIRRLKREIGEDLRPKKVLLLGATGGLGRAVLETMSELGASFIISARSEKALTELKEEYKDKVKDIEVLPVDFEVKESVETFLAKVKSLDFDTLINTLGVYHLPKKMDGNYERIYLVNFLVPSYIEEELLKVNDKLMIVNCGSISYTRGQGLKAKYEDSYPKKKNRYYALTKRLLMAESISLAKKGYDVRLAHPGASYTNLFKKKDGGYNRLFYFLVSPLIKLLFMSPSKASLSLVLSAYKKIDIYLRYGPRGLFKLRGYPKKSRINGKLITDEELTSVSSIIEEFKGERA